MRAASRMEDGAAASLPMPVNQIVDRRLDLRLGQRLADQGALPSAVTRWGQMLECAAAASSEMRADRRDAIRARVVDLDKMPAVGVSGPLIDFDGFTRQCVGHVEHAGGCVRHAVAT